MAIYTVATTAGALIVRADSEEKARQVAGDPAAAVSRISEEGDDGIISIVTGFASNPAPEPDVVDDDYDSSDDEVDITSLSDKVGTRRLKNLRTGRVRIEKR